MIQNSFVILEGISSKLEGSIWSQGIRNWDDFLYACRIKGISSARKLYYDRRLKEAKRELYSLNSSYFIDLLPQSEMWRLYDFFKEEAVFLDIETTGLNAHDSIIMHKNVAKHFCAGFKTPPFMATFLASSKIIMIFGTPEIFDFLVS